MWTKSVLSAGRPELSAGAGMLDDVSTCRVSPVLVGRSEHLTVLAQTLAAVRTGQPATLLVGGEAGVGKTRLVSEFAARAASGDRLLAGGCLELGASGLPFAPFTAILRQLVRELGAGGIGELLAGRASRELGRLLPELGEAAGHDDEAYEGEARARLFEQLLALFGRLAAAGPVTLIIEDAHWADPSTRDLLTFLIVNQQMLPGLLIVVTFRSDELHRTHPLRKLLAELGRIGWVDRIEVPRLSRAEAAEQIAAILGHDPAARLVDNVYRRSEGNPLFVEHLIECGCEVPDSLRDLVLASVQRLPEETRELLRVASPAGARFGPALLAQVSGLDADELPRTLRPAVAGNVLVAEADGYQFRHALIQEAMHEDLLPGEHSRLHARYADAISADPSLVPAGRAAISVAHHWYAAHDVTWALISAWQAAAEAGRVLAHSEQLSMLSRVLELWDSVADAADRIGTDRVSVLEAAVRVSHFTGESDRGIALATSALAELDATAAPARAARLLDQRANLAAWLGRGAGVDDLRAALALVSDGNNERERARVLASLSHLLYKERADTSARAAAQEALVLARREGDPAIAARALNTLAMVDGCTGLNYAGVLELLAEARAAAEQVHDYHLVVTTSINESHTLEGMGEHLRAADVASRGRADAQKFGLSRTNGTVLAVNVVEPLVSAGEWDRAAAVLAEALSMPTTGSHRESLWRLAGDLALARGDLAAAQEALSRAGELLAPMSYRDQSHLPHSRLLIGVRCATGEFADALAHARDAIGRYDLQASPRYAWQFLAAAAGAAADVAELPPAVRTEREAELAQSVLDLVRSEAAKLEASGPWQQAQQQTVRAELDRAGLVPGRLASWQDAAAAWQALGEPYPQAVALFRVAEAALTGGDGGTATESLRSAAALAGRVGAARLGEQIAILARRARIDLITDRAGGSGGADGRPAQPPGPVAQSQRLGLTPREFEVLRLVTDGHSNAAIASELFISAKKVSVHVSNILAKLGVSGRGEAAATAHRLRLFDQVQPPVHADAG
jgi:DNA-binding CsgD family transcriptional regulator